MATELEAFRVWLTGHGLADAEPTPLLATRLKARWRKRLISSVLLAVFLIAVALSYVITLGDATRADRNVSLLALTAAVVALVGSLALLDRWVRRVDQRAGAALPRRAAHPVRLDWRTVLGWPRAVLAAATFAGATAMAIGVLATADDSTGRYPAVMLLIGLLGTGVGMLIQLRHVLTHPAVAEDEASLTADLIMRVEDAREVATPTVVWSLPVVSVMATASGWWTVFWLAFIALGTVAFILIAARTARTAAVARHATSVG